MLVLKYGKQEQKEIALLTLMTTDISVLISLKFGAFLFKEIWKYCSKAKGVSVLNQFFETNFTAHSKKLSSFLALSTYLNQLPLKKQAELLLASKSNLTMDGHSLSELLEHYQKSKNQFELSLYYYTLLLNFEFIN